MMSMNNGPIMMASLVFLVFFFEVLLLMATHVQDVSSRPFEPVILDHFNYTEASKSIWDILTGLF
jgi:hypothetical protein